jgi:N-acetyl-gamma-glutamyl-phosphate reductase
MRVGIVGVSGYGGGELVRLCAGHPRFELVYAAGSSSVGQKLVDRFPGIGRLGELAIEKWDPENLPELDLLFASLPSGESRAALARVPAATKVIDVGGNHRFAEGWTYGLADVWPDQIREAGETRGAGGPVPGRIANPGCHAAAALPALAPLIANGLVEPGALLIDTKTGVSGAGRGGGSTLGFAEVNEDVSVYGLFAHPQEREVTQALSRLGQPVSLTLTPHLIPMTRGILATCYARGAATQAECLEAAREFYRDRPFVRVVPHPLHTKWATGSNLVFVSYAASPERGAVIALGAIDNLGKGAAGQALQNANLITGQPETAGLEGAPLWP